MMAATRLCICAAAVVGAHALRQSCGLHQAHITHTGISNVHSSSAGCVSSNVKAARPLRFCHERPARDASGVRVMPIMLLEEKTDRASSRQLATDHKGGKKGSKKGSRDGLVAASAVASSALIAEAVQIAGTGLMFYFLQQWSGTTTPTDAVTWLISYMRDLGPVAYPVFASLMIFLQVVPIAAAFVLTVSAGAIFGAAQGTAVVLGCSTISATISFFISRSFGRSRVLEAAQKSPQYQAIDRAFEQASFPTSLTMITLLRLSPVLPFSWANYLFGLSGVPWAAFTLGTLVGCAPAVAAYVSAGRLGADIVVNGSETNTGLLLLGIAATILAVSLVGNLASQALKDLDVDLDFDEIVLPVA